MKVQKFKFFSIYSKLSRKINILFLHPKIAQYLKERLKRTILMSYIDYNKQKQRNNSVAALEIYSKLHRFLLIQWRKYSAFWVVTWEIHVCQWKRLPVRIVYLPAFFRGIITLHKNRIFKTNNKYMFIF